MDNTIVKPDGTLVQPIVPTSVDKEPEGGNEVDETLRTINEPSNDNNVPNDSDGGAPTGDIPSDAGSSESSDAIGDDASTQPELNLDPFVQEVRESGSLSDKSLKELADKLGTSEDVVRFTVEGMKAQVEKGSQEVFKAVGGKEVYQEVINWASKALSQADIDAFNSVLTTGTPDSIIGAFVRLKAKFTEANGSPKSQRKNIVPRRSAPTATTNVPKVKTPAFSSMAEMMKAQRDPRYGKDMDYTNMVYAMVANSKF